CDHGARSVNSLFDDDIAIPGKHGTLMFGRLLKGELWVREFIDTDEAPAPQPAANGEPAAVSEDPAQTGEPAEVEEAPKSDYAPNPGKQLDLRSEVDAHTWRR